MIRLDTEELVWLAKDLKFLTRGLEELISELYKVQFRLSEVEQQMLILQILQERNKLIEIAEYAELTVGKILSVAEVFEECERELIDMAKRQENESMYAFFRLHRTL